MYQVGNQPRLYYDAARSTNHQDERPRLLSSVLVENQNVKKLTKIFSALCGTDFLTGHYSQPFISMQSARHIPFL
jgi:hypothetical protein